MRWTITRTCLRSAAGIQRPQSRQRHQIDDAEDDLKIATWNVERPRPGGGARTSRIRDAIALVAADVLVLTETHVDFGRLPSPAALRRRRRHRIVHPANAGRRSGWPPGGSPGRCRFTESRSARALRTSRTIRSASPGVRQRPALAGRSSTGPTAWGGRLCASLSAQLVDIDRIRRGTQDTPFCLLGDLNQELDGPAASAHCRVGMRSGPR
jgi:hypothetical protein